nr:MAG TPA: hypothetical protein [Caudoviricetes sp.]
MTKQVKWGNHYEIYIWTNRNGRLMEVICILTKAERS